MNTDQPKVQCGGTVLIIPYGYRAVTGQLIKGDGIWDGQRFRKVRKDYPFLGTREGVAIRRCEVVQEKLALEVEESEG